MAVVVNPGLDRSANSMVSKTGFVISIIWTLVSQQPGLQGYGDPSAAMTMPLAPAYPGQPSTAHMMSTYPPPPSYCNHPPPSYDQVFKTTEKK
ncbi:hypothetical protein QTP70_031532 [Hemibagrus guttatus]|uniref:WW domain binding protein VOPP1 n=1 Tax=Hemibagrus guttatus TaxID=175788 RepID=A0AAE0VAJ6_9TELE|nr:hypothetical protein QTP70_031532 [Hemibagrus guttatus]